MNMDLQMKMLPAEALIKDYVTNDNQCNYEYYMVELLNASIYFSHLFPAKFVWQSSQSKGECDAYSGKYGVDFKLAVARSKMHVKSVFSYQIEVCMNGMINFRMSKKSGSMKATILHVALRDYTVNDLFCIRRREYKGQSIESDIKYFLKTLETEKNLLLFFPYVFTFSNTEDYSNGDRIVVEAIKHDFLVSMKYRNINAPNYDTFFVTIYNDSFIILRYENGDINYVDLVSTNKCRTFSHLLDYSAF